MNQEQLQLQKQKYIDLYRNNGFNCFPIPEANAKRADRRYDAERTVQNQTILKNENYGVIALEETATVDFDNKERFRPIAETMIDKGFVVIETGNGWHIPVKNIGGDITKVELFDKNIQEEKILEIQGTKHYVIGAYSRIQHEKLGKEVIYENKGGLNIWDIEGMDFHDFIDKLCLECGVSGKRTGLTKFRSQFYEMRERFKRNEIPTPKTSNDYFHQAGLVCLTDGNSIEEATDRIRFVYDKWKASDYFSNRPWSNIEHKIRDVYENGTPLTKGRNKTETDVSTLGIIEELIDTKDLYSNENTHEIYENKGGFLEPIRNSLKRELIVKIPNMTEAIYKDILFKLEATAEPMPKTNPNLIVFNNGIVDISKGVLVEGTEDIADMGFKDFDYVENAEPSKFLEVLFGNIPEEQHERVKAGLKSILTGRLDPRISVLFGKSGVGKSTALLILAKILGVYGIVLELDQLTDDRFIRAKIKDKRLVVLQDLPQVWKDFSYLKSLTGEQLKTERGFHQDAEQFESMIKIWASANYLPKIPDNEKNPMYSRRLSLVENIRDEPYPEDPNLIDTIVKEEGSEIISYLIQLPQSEYEKPSEIRHKWEKLASPEVEFLDRNYKWVEDESVSLSLGSIVRKYNGIAESPIKLKQMKLTLEEKGYTILRNNIHNIKEKNPQTKFYTNHEVWSPC